jgi:hypothetical protein
VLPAWAEGPSNTRQLCSSRLGSRYRSGRSPDWLKFKNPNAPAVKREAEEGVERDEEKPSRRCSCSSCGRAFDAAGRCAPQETKAPRCAAAIRNTEANAVAGWPHHRADTYVLVRNAPIRWVRGALRSLLPLTWWHTASKHPPRRHAGTRQELVPAPAVRRDGRGLRNDDRGDGRHPPN